MNRRQFFAGAATMVTFTFASIGTLFAGNRSKKNRDCCCPNPGCTPTAVDCAGSAEKDQTIGKILTLLLLLRDRVDVLDKLTSLPAEVRNEIEAIKVILLPMGLPRERDWTSKLTKEFKNRRRTTVDVGGVPQPVFAGTDVDNPQVSKVTDVLRDIQRVLTPGVSDAVL